MICTNCSTESKKASRFCGQCGKKLPHSFIEKYFIKDIYKEIKDLYITFFKLISSLVKDHPKAVKYLAAAFLISLVAFEGSGIYSHSKVSYLESILGYQYDFKSGEKLFLSKKNGQYYYSNKTEGTTK